MVCRDKHTAKRGQAEKARSRPTRQSTRCRNQSPHLASDATEDRTAGIVNGPPTVVSPSVTTRLRCKDDPVALPEEAKRLLRRKDANTSCLTFGLKSSYHDHRQSMCDKCLAFCEMCVKRGKVAVTTKRGTTKQCDQPWLEKWGAHRELSKVVRMNNFRAYFQMSREDIEHSLMVATPAVATNLKLGNSKGTEETSTFRQINTDTLGAQSKESESRSTNKSIKKKLALQTVMTSVATQTEFEPASASVQSQTDPTVDLFDLNNIMTEEGVELIEKSFAVRNMKTFPLRTHEQRLLKAAATIFQASLEERANGTPLHDYECRLLGQLAFKGFKCEDKLTLPSFHRFPSFQIVQVPTARVARNKTQKRRYRDHVRVAKKWMGHLPSDLSVELTTFTLAEKPATAKEVLKRHHKNLLQLSPTETLCWQTFSGMSGNQIVKSGRVIEFFCGFRLPAPERRMTMMKKEHVRKTHSTLRQTKVMLEKKVSIAKGKQVFRDISVTVTVARPLELLSECISDLLNNKKFMASDKRFNTPFSLDEGFLDCAAGKIGIDAGGGSTKGIISPVNVEQPQSQKHVRVFLEFSGVKDSVVNIERAAFQKDNYIRHDIESIIHRRNILLNVTINGESRSILVTNTSAHHDPEAPKPLAKNFTGYVDYTPIQPAPMTPIITFNDQTAEVDVAQVSCIKLLHNSVTNDIDGVVFLDAKGESAGRCLFLNPIKALITSQPDFKQILLIGVFTADIEFLAKFVGHQGASARFMCLFCLAIKSKCADVFLNDGKSSDFVPRTIQSMVADANKFKAMMAALSQKDQAKYSERKKITQQHSNSMNRLPMADLLMSCVSPASMHVCLGMIPWLIKCMRKAYRRVEELEANQLEEGSSPPQLRKHLEWAIDVSDDYEQYLKSLLEGTINLVGGHEDMLQTLLSDIAHHQQMIDLSVDEVEMQAWLSSLSDLKERHMRALEEMHLLSNDEAENEAQLLEQLFLLTNMKNDLRLLLSKHDGHSSRVIGEVMAEKGVNEEIYHKGAVVGNGCMRFAERGKDIVSGIDAEMKKLIKSAQGIAYLDALAASLKGIITPLYSVLRVMKSVKRQTPNAIKKFEEDVLALNRAIKKFVTDTNVPGMNIDLPTFLKSHFLFDGNVLNFLKRLHTLGGFDEQNIESTHPIFNQLMGRYGSTRGRQLKRHVMRQFLMDRASFVVELIDEMVRATSKKKRPNTKKRGVADDPSIDELRADMSLFSVELTPLEVSMNQNDMLHPEIYTKEGKDCPYGETGITVDTSLTVCAKCSKRVFSFAAAIHEHEYHSGEMRQDVDNDIIERMKFEASL